MRVNLPITLRLIAVHTYYKAMVLSRLAIENSESMHTKGSLKYGLLSLSLILYNNRRIASKEK